MKQVRILAFSGSNRQASFNKQLIRAAAAIGNGMEHVTVTPIDLKDYPLPMYDGDLEEAEGLPAKAMELKLLIKEHDAVLISSPEYNAAPPALLKNTIDWVSRPGGENDPGKVMFEKPVGLLSASPGGLGGIRGLTQLRAILQNLTAMVIPAQFCLGAAHEAFQEDGSLKDDAARQAVGDVIRQLANVAAAEVPA